MNYTSSKYMPAPPWPVVPMLLGLGICLHWWSVPRERAPLARGLRWRAA